MLKGIFIFILPCLFLALPAQAICPICTVAVGAGVGLSRWLGVDDVVTGIWIGALFISLSLWTIDWMKRKKISFFGQRLASFLVYFIFLILPLVWMDVFSHPLNKLWGMDKLILGILIGVIGFFLSIWLHLYLKKKNNGKVLFPFQKVAVTVGAILILNIVFYFVTKNI